MHRRNSATYFLRFALIYSHQRTAFACDEWKDDITVSKSILRISLFLTNGLCMVEICCFFSVSKRSSTRHNATLQICICPALNYHAWLCLALKHFGCDKFPKVSRMHKGNDFSEYLCVLCSAFLLPRDPAGQSTTWVFFHSSRALHKRKKLLPVLH